MARRRHSSSRRRRDKDSFPWVLAVLFGIGVLAVVCGFGWLVFQANSNRVHLAEDLCRTTGPMEQTIVLVDATDPISPLTQKEILTRLADQAAAVPTNGRFELRTLETGQSRTNKIFSLCNPGTGAEIDGLIGNPAAAQRRWQGSFAEPLEEAMRRVVTGSAGETSPIMAALQEIAVDHLTSQAERAIPTKIIVISDMTENTPDFTMYAPGGPSIEVYRTSRAATAYAVDLAGATVDIWYLRRDNSPASVGLMTFWAEWISINRGRGGTAIALQGLQ